MEKLSVLHAVSPNKKKKSKESNYRSAESISLPFLRNPNRAKIESLLSLEKEKIQQKIRTNYYPNDISYLKDKHIEGNQELLARLLPDDITQIYNKVYGTEESELNFLKSRVHKVVKKSSDNPFDKILSPNKKIWPTSVYQVSAPTGRQEAIYLKNWLESMETKYCSFFKELILGQGDIDRDKLLKAWKAMYVLAFKEIERQISVQCTERGQVIEEIMQGFELIFNLVIAKTSIEIQKQCEIYAKENSEIRVSHAKQLALFQVKLDKTEKEKSELRHHNGQLIIKLREIERQIEDIRRLEKNSSLRSGPKVSTYKYQYNLTQEDKISEPINDDTLSISETLTQEIESHLKKISEVKSSISAKKNVMKSLEIELSDKKTELAALNFEIEQRQSLIKPVAKYMPRNLLTLTRNNDKKSLAFSTNLVVENDLHNSKIFFRNLVSKSKERLESKSNVSPDHIFQSLSVIYKRCITQIEISNEMHDFQLLVYQQFVKGEQKLKGEKKLKGFISGCLKLSEFKRVSVFLRYLGLGEFIENKSFSTRTLQIYLSAFLFMENSQVGLLVYKDSSSPLQYYPLARAQACLKELRSAFSRKQRYLLENFVNLNSIHDPKQINPLGIIELELFLEKMSDEHESLMEDISENCLRLFETVSKRGIIGSEYFKLLISSISPENILDYEEENEEDLMDGIIDVNVNSAIQIACKVHLLSSEDINNFLGDLLNASDIFARNLIESQYPSPIPSLYQNMLDNIDNVVKKYALIWWKIFNK